MLSKRTNGSNGHTPLPPGLVEYIPSALREQISEALEQEGIMNEPVQDRILRAIAEDRKVLQGIITENHKELQLSIHGIEGTLHDHDKRITLVEDSVSKATSERADTKRLVKSAVIGIAVLLAVTGVMGYYGLKGPSQVTPEAKQEAKQEASDIKDLIKEIRQDREDRKTEQAAPVNVPPTNRYVKPRTTKPKGQSLALPPGAEIVFGRGLAFATYKNIEALERRF